MCLMVISKIAYFACPKRLTADYAYNWNGKFPGKMKLDEVSMRH